MMAINWIIAELGRLPVDASDKKNIVITALGRKRTAITYLSDVVSQEAAKGYFPIPDQLRNRYTTILSQLGLGYKEDDLTYRRADRPVKIQKSRFFIGNLEDAIALQKAFKTDNHMEVGRLLGFPESVIRPKLNGTTAPLHDYLRRNYTVDNVPDYLLFIEHVPRYGQGGMPDHESVEWARSHNDLLEKVSPIIYRQFLEKRKAIIFTNPASRQSPQRLS